MNITQLTDELDQMVVLNDKTSVMIWGPPGVGKTDGVRQVAAKHGLMVIDERWGQKTPADLRLPVPNKEKKVMEFYPMSTFPREGKGIYFLDEFTMAHSVMQGIGQQLILDRCIGDNKLGDGWFVWAAGNRKEDKAAVYDMPLPTSNRFDHLYVEPDLESLTYWWFAKEKDPRIMGFLKFRPELLHKMPQDSSNHRWPSPRTWARAEARLVTKRSIAPAVGEEVAVEFSAWAETVDSLPDTEQIAEGKGKRVKFSDEPSLKFAIISSLTAHALKNFEKFYNCFSWMLSVADTEWTSMLVLDVLRILGRNDPKMNQQYMAKLMKMPEAREFINVYVQLATGRS